MPIVSSDTPKLLTAGLKTLFMQEFNNGLQEDFASQIASVVPSNKNSETYAWLGATPQMREWKDERIPGGLTESSYTIINKLWESSIAVARTEIEDDQYGQIALRVRSLADECKRHQEQIVMELLALGATTNCYDGQYFFDTDHVTAGAVNQTAQSNKGTTALSVATLETGITAMYKFKDDQGKPMGNIADTLVVPPDLEWTARELLESQFYPGGTSTTDYQKLPNNVLRGKLKLIVSPYLTDTDNWYLLATKRILKPLIFQTRMPVTFDALESTSDAGFMRDEYVYGVRSRYNVGFGPWQYAYGGIV